MGKQKRRLEAVTRMEICSNKTRLNKEENIFTPQIQKTKFDNSVNYTTKQKKVVMISTPQHI